MSLTIRPVTESDWPLIEQLYPVYIAELPTEDDDASEAMLWMRRAFDHAQAGERQFWLAYAEDGQLVGFTIFGVFDNFPGSERKYAQLMDFYIVPQVRRQGAGRELARSVFAAMRQAGASVVELDVLRENHRGLSFWQSLGMHNHHHVLKMPLT